MRPDGTVPRLRGALISDSAAAMLGAAAGTSTTTSYIESALGINAGGRTGLTAAAVGVLFLLALFLSPLAASIPAYATAPALLYVACLMARSSPRSPCPSPSRSPTASRSASSRTPASRLPQAAIAKYIRPWQFSLSCS
jgi:hypothetical protein